MPLTTVWITSYPTNQDVPGNQQPNLTNDSSPGAEDGDFVLVSHVQALRDKLQAVATKLGDNNNLPAMSVLNVLNVLGVVNLRTTDGGGTMLSIGSITNGQVLTRSGSTIVGATLGDQLVKVSANDTTASYLLSKLVAGANVTLTELNDGGNETLQVSVTSIPAHAFAGADHTASTKALLDTKVSDADLISTLGSEINALTLKGSPVGADVLVIEDSADSFNKKKVAISSLPGGGGGVGSSGQKFITVIPFGDQDSYASSTGKIKKTMTVNPNDFVLSGATRSIQLRVMAGLGNTPNTGRVKLINETDADDVVANVTFTVAAQTLQTATITIGAGAGQMDDSAKVYRLEISVDGTPTPVDTIEFGGADLHIINTIT